VGVGEVEEEEDEEEEETAPAQNFGPAQYNSKDMEQRRILEVAAEKLLESLEAGGDSERVKEEYYELLDRANVSRCVCMCVHACVCVYVCISMYVYLYTWTQYTHTHTHTWWKGKRWVL